MTNLVVGVDDWSALGVTPSADTILLLRLVKPILGDRVTSTESWSVRLDSEGSATVELPELDAGNGLEISLRLFQGLPIFTVAGYAGESVTLAQLFNDFRVDPASLQPFPPAPEAWWEALAGLTAPTATTGVAAPNGSTPGVLYIQESGS